VPDVDPQDNAAAQEGPRTQRDRRSVGVVACLALGAWDGVGCVDRPARSLGVVDMDVTLKVEPARPASVLGQSMPEQVLAYPVRTVPDDGHERATHEWVARQVAALFDVTYGGIAGTQRQAARATYYVPDDTLSSAQARALGIESACDLFGGVVPLPFLASKVVVHPLLAIDAAQPQGWSQSLGLALRACTLPGLSAFCAEDAMRAYAELAAEGRTRLKLPTGIGGRGQWRLESADDLARHLAALPDNYLAAHGVVLERHLEKVVTYSVGETECAGLRIAYHGTQALTGDREGREVYGGSDLCIQRGTFDDLAASRLPPRAGVAVRAAHDFDRAVRQAYPDLLVSRRNYDVACGVDAHGQAFCGVLEQSWRIGGATPAELAGLHAFQREPALTRLHACTRELHGRPAPAGAEVYYAGDDPRLGPLVKYRISNRS